MTTVLVLAFFIVNAQTKLYHKSEPIIISSGTNVKVVGDFITVATGSSDIIGNAGELYISDSLVNKGNQNIFGSNPSTGTVHFDGTTQQYISGIDTINFCSVNINNTNDTIVLDQNIGVTNRLLFSNGNLLLDSNNINLGVTGYFSNETNLNRAVGYPGTISLERVIGTGSFVNNIAGIGLGGEFGGSPGTMTIVREHISRPGPATGSIDKYFRLSSTQTGTFIDPKLFYFDNTDLAILDEDSLAIYTSETNGNIWRSQLGTRNIVADDITSVSTVTLNLNSGTVNDLLITAAHDSCKIDPSSGIVFDTLGLCSGAPIWITAENIGGLDLTWSNGQTSVDSIQVSTAGTYYLKMINAQGCTSTDTVVVITSPSPNAAFNLSSNSICLGDSIGFTNTSSVSAGSLTYFWDFGEATLLTDTSSLTTPSDFTFSESGLFVVSLQVTSNYGCTDSYNENVTVKPNPIADFTMVDTITCDLGPIAFTNTSSVAPVVALQYDWDFGDLNVSNTQSPSHTYALVGTYNVQLISSYLGCADTITKQLEIAPTPVASFAAPSVCLGDTTSFSNLSSISAGSLSYLWNFGDGNTSTDSVPNYLYTTSGTYNVVLTVTSAKGCIDSTTLSVDVFQTPTANFTVPSGSCLQGPVTFTNTSTITPLVTMTYEWDYGDLNTSNVQSPTHTYAVDGTYNVSLVSTYSGCTDTIVKQVIISPAPVVAFGSSSVCLGDTTQFTNTSSVSTGSLTYSWDFGDNTFSTDSVPTHVYNTAGTYSVLLVVTSNTGCIDSIRNNAEVYPYGVPDFTVLNACQDANLTFTNTSTISSGSLSCLWKFSDGDTTSLTVPVKSFSSDGSYTANLIVTSNNGCVDSISKNITIYPIPVADFIFNDGCQETTLNFTNTSSISSGSLSYNWDFDNGAVITSNINEAQQFNTSGLKNVELIATSGFGCADTIIKQVTVYAAPIVALSDTITTCGNSYVLDAGNVGSSYFWSTGDITQTTTALVTGNYDVTVTNSDNCVSSDTVYVGLNQPVKPNLGLDTSFCVSGILDAGYPGATFLWSDNSTNQQLSVSTNNTYWVTVTDQNSCVGSDTINISINPLPTLGLGNDTTICSGLSLLLDPNNSNPGNTYLWSDNSTNGNLTVNSAGSYWVDISDINNCSASDTIVVSVATTPVVTLGNDTAGCDSLTIFASSVLGASYNWNSGLSSDDSLMITSSGMYYVETSIGVGVNYCESSDTINITINTSPMVDLGNDTTICSGVNLLLDPNNSALGNTYLWSDNSTNGNLTVSSQGNYWVQIDDINNCSATDTIEVLVASTPVVDLGNDTTVCDSLLVGSSAIVGATYDWNNGLSSMDSLLVSVTGTYFVEVSTGVGVNNCSASDTIIVTVNNSPVVDLGNDTVLCDGLSLLLDPNNSNPGNTYLWSNISNNPTLSVSTTGNYSVEITDLNNCSSSDTVQVTFTILPTIFIGNDTTVCDKLTLLTNNIIGATYDWNNGLSSTNSLLVSNTGTYFVEVSIGQGANSCSVFDTILVTVNNSPSINLGVDTSLCSYQTILLDAGPGFSYLWNDGSFLQTKLVGTTSPIWVKATDLNGCFAIDSININVNPDLNLDLGADKIICSNQIAVLQSNVLANSYTWRDVNNVIATTPSVTVGSGDYWLTVVDSVGCIDSDSIEIVSSSLSLGAHFLAASTVNVGDTLKIVNLSYPVSTFTSVWDFGDLTTSTEESPTKQYNTPGLYDIKLSVTNNFCFDSLTKQVEVVVPKRAISSLDSIHDLSKFLAYKIYPNPNNGNFVLDVELSAVGAMETTIINVLGEILYEYRFEGDIIIENFSLQGISKGIYFVRSRVSNQVRMTKIIVN